MFQSVRDVLFPQGLGSDLFGEQFSARMGHHDDNNKYLFMQMTRDYLAWHEANHRFYEGYKEDRKYLHLRQVITNAYAVGGFCFAAIIINPNFTSKNSFYLRKVTCLLSAYAFYAWGKKREDQHLQAMMLKMNDYFPLEVKRALQDKDFRHMALFNWENPGRKLFDDVTGKSLS
eukprot:403335981